ncbi:MAG: poly-gamma-glutamate system protein [Longimicrobiales bacterium]
MKALFSRMSSGLDGRILQGEARSESTRRRILLAGGLSLLAWVLLQWLSPPAEIPWSEPMLDAAREMDRGLRVSADHCRQAGIAVDRSLDPGGTCLVGPRDSPLFTSLGSLEAKRTSLTPDLAGLLAHLLREAGVTPGDTVGVGASGSFPGLLLATLSAVKAVGAHPVTILSLGASSYGASRPEFHLLDLYELLGRAGIVSGPPAAVSLGGEGDVGPEIPVELVEELGRQAARMGVPFLDEPEFSSNVARRMGIYGRPAVFVNVGGAEANMGLSPSVLEIPAGLVLTRASGESSQGLSVQIPPPDQRGVLFEMLARGVPVIHLLHIRGLALRHGVPWDPMPIPDPGSTPLRDGEPSRGWGFWLLTAAYLVALAAVGLFRRSRPRSPDSP